MRDIKRGFISKKELLLIFILALFAIIFIMLQNNRTEQAYARITVQGYQYVLLPLSYNIEFILPQNPNVVFTVQNGQAAFIASDCPDKICINTGFIYRSGQSAACLPNLVYMIIVGGSGVADSYAAVVR